MELSLAHTINTLYFGRGLEVMLCSFSVHTRATFSTPQLSSCRVGRRFEFVGDGAEMDRKQNSN